MRVGTFCSMGKSELVIHGAAVGRVLGTRNVSGIDGSILEPSPWALWGLLPQVSLMLITLVLSGNLPGFWGK